jgi:predicted nuclease of restriction endonuclease-like (RecB) superfamily
MQIKNEPRREFYIEECEKASWSVRQLKRQIDTLYYDRILASKNKDSVANEISELEPKPDYE